MRRDTIHANINFKKCLFESYIRIRIEWGKRGKSGKREKREKLEKQTYPEMRGTKEIKRKSCFFTDCPLPWLRSDLR